MKKLFETLEYIILGLIVCPTYDFLYKTFIMQKEFTYNIDMHLIFPLIIIISVVLFISLCSKEETI